MAGGGLVATFGFNRLVAGGRRRIGRLLRGVVDRLDPPTGTPGSLASAAGVSVASPDMPAVAVGLPALTYASHCTPREPFDMGDGVLLVPGPREAFEFHSSSGQSASQWYFETSLLVDAARSMNWAAFEMYYRDWVAFDAFVFDDPNALRMYNAGLVGKHASWIPSLFGAIDLSDEFRRVDYRDVSYHVYFPTRVGFRVDYRVAWQRYRGLSEEQKALIEYCVCRPAVDAVGSTGTRTPFSSARLWEVIHACTVLEDLLGMPDPCPAPSPRCSTCGRTPPAHDRVGRAEWRHTRLAAAVPSTVLPEYSATIEAAFRLRHRAAHQPRPDGTESRPPPPGFTEVYDVDRIVAEARTDQLALVALSDNARRIGRFLLLREFFGFDSFPPLGRWWSTTLDHSGSVSDATVIDRKRAGVVTNPPGRAGR